MSLALHAWLLAHPAQHSLSPAMHRAAMQWAGISGDYQAEDVPPSALEGRLAQFRAAAGQAKTDAFGLNLSLPHKVTVLPLLDGLTPEASAIGAVNTVMVRRQTKDKTGEQVQLWGHNTDGLGLVAALAEAGFGTAQAQRAARTGKLAVLLGAGGAARAGLWALEHLTAGATPLPTRVINRTYAKAEALASRAAHTQAATLETVDWSKVALVINATSVGLTDKEATPLPLSRAQWQQLPRQALVYDMVYGGKPTQLLRNAEAAGLRAAGGLGMLAQQGALAFACWTGINVPAHVMAAAAAEALAMKAQP